MIKLPKELAEKLGYQEATEITKERAVTHLTQISGQIDDMGKTLKEFGLELQEEIKNGMQKLKTKLEISDKLQKQTRENAIKLYTQLTDNKPDPKVIGIIEASEIPQVEALARVYEDALKNKYKRYAEQEPKKVPELDVSDYI